MAKLLDRIAESPLRLDGGVMYDSCDQYYVTCEDIAERFREWLNPAPTPQHPAPRSEHVDRLMREVIQAVFKAQFG